MKMPRFAYTEVCVHRICLVGALGNSKSAYPEPQICHLRAFSGPQTWLSIALGTSRPPPQSPQSALWEPLKPQIYLSGAPKPAFPEHLWPLICASQSHDRCSETTWAAKRCKLKVFRCDFEQRGWFLGVDWGIKRQPRLFKEFVWVLRGNIDRIRAQI